MCLHIDGNSMNFSAFSGQRNSGVFLSHSYHKLVEGTFRPSYSTSRHFSCLNSKMSSIVPLYVRCGLFKFFMVLGAGEAERLKTTFYSLLWSKAFWLGSCKCKTFTQTWKAERKRSISTPVIGVGSHANR